MEILPSSYNYILFLSFDFDAESAEVLRGADPVELSRGRYGARKAIYKILDLLDEYRLKVTFFVPGWVAEKYPEAIAEILKRGHEVAGHGYLHERLDKLKPRENEEAVFDKMEKAIAGVTGAKPSGFRAPYWRWSDSTLDILASRGYIYDSSLMDDDEPYVIERNGTYIVELPVDWRLDDWPYLEQHRSLTPSQLLEMWLEEIEYTYENKGYLALTMHPQCIGRGARINVLRRIIEKALDTGAWIPRGIDLANHVLRALGLTTP